MSSLALDMSRSVSSVIVAQKMSSIPRLAIVKEYNLPTATVAKRALQSHERLPFVLINAISTTQNQSASAIYAKTFSTWSFPQSELYTHAVSCRSVIPEGLGTVSKPLKTLQNSLPVVCIITVA